jgi:predicted dehydrogenase
MARLRMAVVGVGHLGKEHARILAGLGGVELVGVVDVNAEQAQAVARRVGCRAYTDFRAVLPLVDAACVVVPTAHHYAVAGEFLRHGIPLLIEKPLTLSAAQADVLLDLADRHGALIQVGHIERFNPVFQEIQCRPLRPKYVVCERAGPFSGRSLDIGVVLDLMVHDLDLVRTLVRSEVTAVEGLGLSLFGGQEDVANARLHFADGCVADFTASRASRSASRQMQLWAPEGYARLDFMNRRLTLIQPSDQMRRHGIDPRQLDAAALADFKQDLYGRHLQVQEIDLAGGDQLTWELQHFVQCVQTGTRPCVSGEDGREVVALAERILDSLRAHAWEGSAEGPVGPLQLPAPRGVLLHAPDREAA